jgi:hypothetical protein
MRKYFILISFFLQSLFISAQLPVSKEPMHHNVFENAFVRVLDVHVQPGDTSLFHKHETPSVFIVLTPAKTGSEVIMEEKKATALANDATISFEGFYTKPRIHRVWNEDTTEFHVMDLEILNKKRGNVQSPIQQNEFHLLFDEKPVRTYRLLLKEGQKLSLERQAPFLIVGLSDSLSNVTVNKKSFHKKGDFLFIPPAQSIHFTNEDHQPSSFAILELK